MKGLGNRLWLRCNACGHSLTPRPRQFAAEHHFDMLTPLLLIARRLSCTPCNERKAHCRSEPYWFGLKDPWRGQTSKFIHRRATRARYTRCYGEWHGADSNLSGLEATEGDSVRAAQRRREGLQEALEPRVAPTLQQAATALLPGVPPSCAGSLTPIPPTHQRSRLRGATKLTLGMEH